MGNFELLDNLFQIAVLLCACCAAGFFALRHKSRSLLILSLAYACFAMGTTYYVLYLVIMGIWPQVFYVAEISWLAAWLFYLSAQIERTEGGRVGFSCPAALAAAVLAATAFLDRDFGPSVCCLRCSPSRRARRSISRSFICRPAHSAAAGTR